jgi:hypothetical protein
LDLGSTQRIAHLISAVDSYVANCEGAGTPDADGQGMMTPKTEEDLAVGYRPAAEECRQQAARSATTLLRDHWLKIADEWITLAEGEDRTETTKVPAAQGVQPVTRVGVSRRSQIVHEAFFSDGPLSSAPPSAYQMVAWGGDYRRNLVGESPQCLLCRTTTPTSTS